MFWPQAQTEPRTCAHEKINLRQFWLAHISADALVVWATTWHFNSTHQPWGSPPHATHSFPQKFNSYSVPEAVHSSDLRFNTPSIIDHRLFLVISLTHQAHQGSRISPQMPNAGSDPKRHSWAYCPAGYVEHYARRVLAISGFQYFLTGAGGSQGLL